MSTTVDKINAIQEELNKTQKNKATEKHVGILKAKLAKLRRELITPTGSGSSSAGAGFDVARSGASSVGLIGFPSVGKSTLINKLTANYGLKADADAAKEKEELSATGAYEFTTLTAMSSIIRYRGAKLQIIDLPGIIEGAKDGRGRGKQVIAVARTCNLIFIVLDVNKPLAHKQLIERELEGFGIRLNKEPPNIVIKKKEKGGISISNTVPLTHIDHDEIKAVMNEYRMNSADIAIRCDATIDDLIDTLEANQRRYIPAVYVLNKIDSFSIEELDLLNRVPNAVPISSGNEWNFEELMEVMWEKMNLVRVYTKPKGKLPDFDDPVVLRSDHCTVEDFCNQIHKSLVEDFRNAVVYGSSVKHQPQYVGLSHKLEDEDVVTVLKK